VVRTKQHGSGTLPDLMPSISFSPASRSVVLLGARSSPRLAFDPASRRHSFASASEAIVLNHLGS
jgi:hypothetical protein